MLRIVIKIVFTIAFLLILGLIFWGAVIVNDEGFGFLLPQSPFWIFFIYSIVLTIWKFDDPNWRTTEGWSEQRLC